MSSRLKVYNSHTNRWVYLDGASAKKYLGSISYREIVRHPLGPDQFVVVIDSAGREIPTPFPNPKTLSVDDEDEHEQRESATAPAPAASKCVRFSPSTKTHDGLCTSMAFLEHSARTLFSKTIDDIDYYAELFCQAVERAQPQVDVMKVLATAVGAMMRAKGDPDPVYLINTGSSSLMYSSADPNQTRALLVILQGCQLFVTKNQVGQRPLPM